MLIDVILCSECLLRRTVNCPLYTMVECDADAKDGSIYDFVDETLDDGYCSFGEK